MCGNSVNSVQLYRKLTNNITAIMYCYNTIKSEIQLHVATVYMYRHWTSHYILLAHIYIAITLTR